MEQVSGFSPTVRQRCCQWWSGWCGLLVWGLIAGPSFAQAPADGNAPQTNAEELLLDQSLDGELPESMDRSHPLVPALRVAYASRRVLSNVRDYSATLVKQELVQGKIQTNKLDLKVREEPFSVYAKFIDPHAGREVLFIEGANNGKLLVREAGLKRVAGLISLDPRSPMAMADNRYPLTEVGLSKLLDTIISQWELEGKYGEIQVEWYPEAKLGNAPCRVIQTSHPQRRKQFKFHKTRLYLDGASLVPVRVDQFDWPAQPGQEPPQIELYMYSGVRTNLNLTDFDFDTNNPAYKFR